jgi:hypothetical protein
MCGTFLATGVLKLGDSVTQRRVRISGFLSRGRRGLILTSKDDQVWAIEMDQPADALIGNVVVVDGVLAGFDRLRADWVGLEAIAG